MNKVYTQQEVNRVHDILTDLLISTFLKCSVRERPKIGDWCIELSSLLTEENRDCIIGKLIEVKGDGEYTTELVGGKIIDWHNAEMYKIPQNKMRKV